MLVEAIGKPMCYRWPEGEVQLVPGQPVDLPEERALRLLAKAPGKVKVVSWSSDVVIEPAAPNARPVYWERGDGHIYGPAVPEFLAKVGTGATDRFWVIVEYQGQAIWVRSDRWRSRKAFETQPTLRTVEPIREPR